MNATSLPVEQLRNIGPTIASRLKEVGIRARADLLAVGPVAAYRRIRARYPGKTIPVCYYLYSLEGALRGRHWDAIDQDVKRSLVDQVRPPKPRSYRLLEIEPVALRVTRAAHRHDRRRQLG